jgi:hypothetical protein
MILVVPSYPSDLGGVNSNHHNWGLCVEMTGARLVILTAVNALLVIVGCTSAPPNAVSTSGDETPFITNTAFNSGQIVAIRMIVVGAADDDQTGIDAVLAALREPAVVSQSTLQELVVNRADDTATSVVVGTSGFAIGDHVTLIAGAETAVIRRY